MLQTRDIKYIYIYIIEVELTFNVLGTQQGDSVIQITRIILEIIFYQKLLQDIDYTSLCYTLNLFCLLNI